MARFDLRPATRRDVRPAFEVLWTSLWDLFARTGAIPPDLPLDIDRAWPKMGWAVEHLAEEGARFWVAEGESGLVGMARSLERDGVVQLTEFFVDPGHQGAGIGRALLDHVFPVGWGRHRSIIATTEPRALALYLRYGVEFRTTLVQVAIEPIAHASSTDLEVVDLRDLDDPVGAIGGLDRRFLDHERPADIEFFMRHRQGWAFRRSGEIVGYGFGVSHGAAGPMLVAEPNDLPAALSHLENAAAHAQAGKFNIELALDASAGIGWSLERGHRLVPFYTALLGSSAFVPRDRYMVFGPALMF